MMDQDQDNHSISIESQNSKVTKDDLCAKSNELRKKGYFLPAWTDRGGKNKS